MTRPVHPWPSSGMHDPAGEHQRPGGGVDEQGVGVAGIGRPVPGADLLGDQAIGGVGIGNAQQRLGQAQQQHAFLRTQVVLLQERIKSGLLTPRGAHCFHEGLRKPAHMRGLRRGQSRPVCGAAHQRGLITEPLRVDVLRHLCHRYSLRGVKALALGCALLFAACGAAAAEAPTAPPSGHTLALGASPPRFSVPRDLPITGFQQGDLRRQLDLIFEITSPITAPPIAPSTAVAIGSTTVAVRLLTFVVPYMTKSTKIASSRPITAPT